MKRCNKCKEWKDETEFPKNKRSSDGLDYRCKTCKNIEIRQWRKDNPDKSKHANSQWRKNNLDRVKLNSNRYKENNLEKVMLNSSKQRAKKHGLEFNITIEDIVIPDVCPVLGIPLKHSPNGFTINTPSLDRIDNSKGYIKGNVIVVSHRANRLKSDATAEELRKLANYYDTKTRN